MKKIFLFALIFFLAGGFVFIACKKEYSCKGSFNCNKPPIALAGLDELIEV